MKGRKMNMEKNKEFGTIISGLINNENYTREEMRNAFSLVLRDKTSEMQQGAFLAALTAKGETAEEVAGAWDAIYSIDTVKATLDSDELVDNCGTGMDTAKTFNISTAASLVAAAGGVKMARHGARAITSICGTVDLAEALGVDVECSIETIEQSIKKAGIGLFNGMSPEIHPAALGRILSRIAFGSTLNIAASLANPALPRIAVRGVYSKELLVPVVEVMQAIGYRRALVLYGSIEGSDRGMDEASVCGTTYCAELRNNRIEEFTFGPEDFGMEKQEPESLLPELELDVEVRNVISLLDGKGSRARTDALVLNAATILYVADHADSIMVGTEKAEQLIKQGKVIKKLKAWVMYQNSNPEIGLKKLEALLH